MLKRSICLVMVLILMLPAIGVHAEGAGREPVPTRYNYVSSVYASLSISGNIATCGGKGRGMYTDTTTHIYVTLQRKADGSSAWQGVKSWSASASGIGTALVSENWTVASGYSYRVRVRCQIKDSDGNVLETVYHYSPIRTI